MRVDIPNTDKAGKDYWERTERNQQIEMRPFTPESSGIRNFGKRMWHKAFESALSGVGGSGRKLLEMGCGGSDLLPYFARQFGFQIYGLDYAEHGCQLARQLCEASGVPAEIICADFFDAPTQMMGAYDVVVSFGVVEHFTDTAHVLSTFGKFLKPEGLIITTVPNMSGLVGLAQRMLASDIFHKHIALNRDSFRKAHEKAGLQVLHCEPFLFTNFGVVNPGSNPPVWKKAVFLGLRALTGVAWALESVVGPIPPNSISSPYLICIARKSI
jgi:2-polyprenyl-3-methyl-5-hydroxy-6-metoxy-1,4-benzoquinol methylase